MINNLYTGREYYITPAREAAKLESLGELNLSKQTERYLRKYYKTLQEIIWHGRHTAYLVDRDESYQSLIYGRSLRSHERKTRSGRV